MGVVNHLLDHRGKPPDVPIMELTALVPSLPVVLFSILLVLLLLYYKFFYSPYQVLKRNGIKGPSPSFFYGNYKDRIKMGGLLNFVEMLQKEYGSIAGYYIGQVPIVVTTDLELIKRVTVKDFDNFQDRQIFPAVLREKGSKGGLLTSRGEYWRSSRRTLSPTFSSFKLKAMVPLIHNSVKTLVDVFKKRADTGESFEVFKTYGFFTMETILATAFGRVVEIQKGESDKLADAAKSMFVGGQEDKNTSSTFFIVILSNFPWLFPILRFIISKSERKKAITILYQTAAKLIQDRRREKEPGKYKDLLQLMIDATVEEEGAMQDNKSKKKLTDLEISSHSLTFMLAGYETTSNALSYTSYLLALNPEIQEKLQNEIESYYQDNPDASMYQATTDIEYLDMVLQESLRLYPPAPTFSRECSEAYRYKDITIPKKAVVDISSFLLLKDPKYWEDPDTFDPLRFTAEEKAKRPPMCYMPFGFGPRNCIGMRFALLEAKMALIQVLRKFTFVRAPDTEVPLQTVVGVTMAPKNGIYLKLVTKE